MKYYPAALTITAFIAAAIIPSSEATEFFAAIDKYGTVGLVFLLTGLLVDDQSLYGALKQWKTSVFIQIYNFAFVPVFIKLFVAFISYIVSIDQWIVNGFTAVACMPPAMCSAVLLTSVAKGNEATAALNAIIGTLLGIYLTPPLLIAHMGVSSSVPTGRMLAWLTLGCLLPLLLGRFLQCLAHFFCRLIPHSIWPVALFIVNLSSFSDLFRQAHFTVTAAEFLGIVLIVIAVQILLMYISVRLVTIRPISDEDCVAVMFSSMHKTLALGIAMVNALYGGYAHVSHTSLPLVIYNAVQLILGSLIAPSALRLCSRFSKRPSLPT